MWILLCLYFLTCCMFVVPPPRVAKAFTVCGKIEQHRCTFFSKEIIEAKEATNSSYASNKDLVLMCLQSSWPHAMKSFTGMSPAQPACWTLKASLTHHQYSLPREQKLPGHVGVPSISCPGSYTFSNYPNISHPCLSALPHLAFYLLT